MEASDLGSKKKRAADSQGCPRVVLSTLPPKVCKLRMELQRESHTGRHKLLRPFLLWGL